MASKALPTSISRVLYTILCIPTAVLAMAASSEPTGEQQFPVLMSPIPLDTPGAPEADASTFASHPAAPASVGHELPMEQLVASAALRRSEISRKTGTAFRAAGQQMPARTFSSASAEATMELSNPLDTDSAGPELNPEDAAKPNVCPSDKSPFINAPDSSCRVFMYRNTAGTVYDIYTGWFVDETHVVTAGVAVAPGGTGKYNVFSVKGRYGTVCCASPSGKPIPAGGPDNCATDRNFNITRAVTTTGWLTKNQISNSAAVLKVVGLDPYPSTTDYQQANPLCLTNVGVAGASWGGYPYPATAAGCSASTITDGTGKAFLASYTSPNEVPGTLTCSTDVNSPAWTFFGPACAGLLGGPLFPGDGSFYYIGILTTVSDSCDATTGKSKVGFTAVSDGGTAWGFTLSKMVAAIP
jgi:hypothetical protein